MRKPARASRLRSDAPCAALALLVLACAGRRDAPANGSGTPRHDLSRVQIGLIDWYTDYDAALAIAAREHKPLLVHFGENPG